MSKTKIHTQSPRGKNTNVQIIGSLLNRTKQSLPTQKTSPRVHTERANKRLIVLASRGSLTLARVLTCPEYIVVHVLKSRLYLEAAADALHGDATSARVRSATCCIDLVGEGVSQGYRSEQHLDADEEVLVAR